MRHNHDNPNNLRVIKTARDEAAINQAAKAGLRPLLRRLKPSRKIRSKFAVYQNRKTGEIEVVGDFRASFPNEDWECVIGWSDHYPHSFPAPFAAYLIPQDIQKGERVLLEDLIEDFVGKTWNQGDAYRLDSCEAVWTGENLKIQYDPKRDQVRSVG